MGLFICLEDETGTALDSVGDPLRLINSLLPTHGDESFICLRFVDLYGDTTFNRMQSRVLLTELERIATKASSDAQRELIERVKELVRHCDDEPHQYVKFHGD